MALVEIMIAIASATIDRQRNIPVITIMTAPLCTSAAVIIITMWIEANTTTLMLTAAIDVND